MQSMNIELLAGLEIARDELVVWVVGLLGPCGLVHNNLLLKKCIQHYGEGKWHRVPLLAGLNRCRKSCRLRWLNYLRPDIKRGSFAEEEEVELIIKLHKLLGNRWSLIAGRTANDVKNYWSCHLRARDEDESSAAPLDVGIAIPPPTMFHGDGDHQMQTKEDTVKVSCLDQHGIGAGGGDQLPI
ncbi:hypothetical protein L6164_010648 [Bauhinia variegata]|uniref:Uncharacterized protein n=1 Tax=Bauhinia variegata TaxID=167791 RepID=A0ACB9PQ40_BAUVA|nr:hypothetical protein L6164_010648 [Bauhinia variegata]